MRAWHREHGIDSMTLRAWRRERCHGASHAEHQSARPGTAATRRGLRGGRRLASVARPARPLRRAVLRPGGDRWQQVAGGGGWQEAAERKRLEGGGRGGGREEAARGRQQAAGGRRHAARSKQLAVTGLGRPPWPWPRLDAFHDTNPQPAPTSRHRHLAPGILPPAPPATRHPEPSFPPPATWHPAPKPWRSPCQSWPDATRGLTGGRDSRARRDGRRPTTRAGRRDRSMDSHGAADALCREPPCAPPPPLLLTSDEDACPVRRAACQAPSRAFTASSLSPSNGAETRRQSTVRLTVRETPRLQPLVWLIRQPGGQRRAKGRDPSKKEALQASAGDGPADTRHTCWPRGPAATARRPDRHAASRRPLQLTVRDVSASERPSGGGPDALPPSALPRRPRSASARPGRPMASARQRSVETDGLVAPRADGPARAPSRGAQANTRLGDVTAGAVARQQAHAPM